MKSFWAVSWPNSSLILNFDPRSDSLTCKLVSRSEDLFPSYLLIFRLYSKALCCSLIPEWVLGQIDVLRRDRAYRTHCWWIYVHFVLNFGQIDVAATDLNFGRLDIFLGKSIYILRCSCNRFNISALLPLFNVTVEAWDTIEHLLSFESLGWGWQVRVKYLSSHNYFCWDVIWSSKVDGQFIRSPFNMFFHYFSNFYLFL